MPSTNLVNSNECWERSYPVPVATRPATQPSKHTALKAYSRNSTGTETWSELSQPKCQFTGFPSTEQFSDASLMLSLVLIHDHTAFLGDLAQVRVPVANAKVTTKARRKPTTILPTWWRWRDRASEAVLEAALTFYRARGQRILRPTVGGSPRK